MNEDLVKLQVKKEVLEEQANRLLAHPLVAEFYFYYQEITKVNTVINALQQTKNKAENEA